MKIPPPQGITKFHKKPYDAIDPTRPALSAADKTVCITGGGAGLGLAIAEHFAKAGCTKLVIIGRRANLLVAAKRNIEKSYPGCEVLALGGDIGNRDDVFAAFKKVDSVFGKVDVLVSNAARLAAYERLGEELSAEEWWKSFETNIKGSHNLLCAFKGYAAKDAVLINVVSAAVNAVMVEQGAYASCKAALTRLFEIFQVENPRYRVVNVAPGFFDSEMHRFTERHFVKKGWSTLELDDIALPASYMVWLASKEAEFLRGKLVWTAWDVTELRTLVEKNSEDASFLQLVVNGVPNMIF